MSTIAKHIIRFVVLLLLQLLLINNLHWLGLVHPYIYVLVLIMLPITFPAWAEMLVGAAIGLIMDAFYSTPGIHMAACVMITYIQPKMITALVQDSQRISTQVCSATVGNWPFLITCLTLTFIHHTMVLYLEAWSMARFWWTLLSVVVSTAVTFTLAVLYDRLQQ